MEGTKILVVDDEADILELLNVTLSREGFRVTCADTGEKALDLMSHIMPDLVLLDLMLPGIQGLDVARHLKTNASTGKIPIIILSAKNQESDILAGLEVGADEYVTKPFSPKVLVAKVKAVLRRTRDLPKETGLRVRDLTIRPEQHKVFVKGRPVNLTLSEFRILHVLVQKPGWVFSRPQIVGLIHSGDYTVTERSVDVQIVSLRRKLGTECDYIETVRGVGYRFNDKS